MLGGNRLVYLSAKVDDIDLDISKDYLVKLKSPLGAGKSVTLEIAEIYYGGIRAFPTEIKQMDSQLVIVEHNLYYSTPYATKIQNSKLNIGTKKTESFPKQGNLLSFLIRPLRVLPLKNYSFFDYENYEKLYFF